MTPRPGSYALLAYDPETDREEPVEDGLTFEQARKRVGFHFRAPEIVYEDIPREENGQHSRVFKTPALARRSKRPGA